jgi:hypothetical protein
MCFQNFGPLMPHTNKIAWPSKSSKNYEIWPNLVTLFVTEAAGK